MPPSLRSTDPHLKDLAHNEPPLIEAETQRDTGVKLLRWIGDGAMSAVFLGVFEASKGARYLSETTPRRLAVKFMKPSVVQSFGMQHRGGAGHQFFFDRETEALRRMMEKSPRSEFVVGFYGRGYADVENAIGRTIRLPWIAMEIVDRGVLGASLAERVQAAGGGLDPLRALHLIRGLLAGARALHDEGIIHRDLKPENVLVVGPIDNETPKIADCGIARVAGMAGTIGGYTLGYAGLEQIFPMPSGVRNLLVGPWSDVHALSAVIWYIIGGEEWCPGREESGWILRGERRSLREAQQRHMGFAMEPALLGRLDAVLARSASPVLPLTIQTEIDRTAPLVDEKTWNEHKGRLKGWAADGARHAPRLESVDALAQQILPLLEECATAWSMRALVLNRAATSFRTTQVAVVVSALPIADIHEVDAIRLSLPPAVPRGVAFQSDGKCLVRFGEKLIFYDQNLRTEISVPPEERLFVASATHVVRGPGGGFAVIGPYRILLFRSDGMSVMPLPLRSRGGMVGQIEAVIDDGREFGVVTAETDDSDGAELWRSADGVTWREPLLLQLGGKVRSVAFGPYGYLAVGSSAKKRNARALLVEAGGQAVIYGPGVTDKPPLEVAVCGDAREAWAAGIGFAIAFLDRHMAVTEPIDVKEIPVAMSLDPVSVPWLVTERTVLRRHGDLRPECRWRVYYSQEPGGAPFIAISFTVYGARVIDASGTELQIVPQDIDEWRKPAIPPEPAP